MTMDDCFYVMLGLRPENRERLRAAAGTLPVIFEDECSAQEAARAFAAAAAILGEPKADALRAAERLRWIQMSWAGADVYTKAAWLPEKVAVTTATGCYGGTIAEYLVGAVIAMYRHFPRYARQQAKGVWRPQFPGRGIEGKTVLIVGAGDIGTEFARRLRPFGVRLIGVRRTRRPTPPEYDEMRMMEELPSLWGRADIVSCSLPNTSETAGLLDEAALRAMKPDALLLNVGRGTLVDPDVLADVLASGHLYGAVLDVCRPEPLPPEHPLWRMENVLITPHIAGVGLGNVPETEDKIVSLCCENLERFLAGQPLKSRLDFGAGYCRSK
jgi:phosphoglycerate dehydrogenase-like enzyme